jgi:hypothetical protein
VQVLRRFRDRFLLKCGAGRAFVEFYYGHSPRLARLIAGERALRSATRFALLPLIGLSWVLLTAGGQGVLALGLALLLAAALVRVRFRRCAFRTRP